ncbi:MAG: polymer-forming cytoskeletal protein [Chromatiaceae bacterium]|jgi:cytoskeletal protein CcmA (bactofilin family)
MRKKIRLPPYATIIGDGTEVTGDIRFAGGLHIDGKVVGDVSGLSTDECVLTVGRSGTVEGNLDVACVVIDGTVVGDVRAARRAELAAGARIEGTLHYGVLEMAEGAEVNGKLLHVEDVETPRLIYQRSTDVHGGVTERADIADVDSAEDRPSPRGGIT